MKKHLLILFVILSSFSCLAQIGIGGLSSQKLRMDYTDPKEYEIGGISISGIEFLDKNALISLTGLKVGDKIMVPGERISLAIKKLWEHGLLGDIKVKVEKVEGNYIFLNFELEERPRLTKFAFDGVKKSEADEIREKVNLIRGRVVTDAVLSNTQRKVEKFYVSKGFRSADVQVIQKKDTLIPNSVLLLIKVRKNERIKIEEINFSGNKSYPDERLKRKMKDTKERNPYRVFKASKILPGSFNKDKEAIISFYNSKGFRDANIAFDTIRPYYPHGESVEVDLSENKSFGEVVSSALKILKRKNKKARKGQDHSKNRVAIDVQIDEGREYVFGNMTWTGNYLHTSKELSGILGIEKGTVYNRDLLDKKLNFNPSGQDITSLYMDDGYLFFNLTPVEVNVRGDSIDIEMRIYEGEQAIINRIFVKGNTRTSDHVIRRELRTLPGQKFSRSDLIRSQRELAQLGYFDPEQMGINPIPNPEDGTVDIEYTVAEKANDQFTLSGGWGGFYGFVGTVGLVFNNFSAKKITKLKEYDPLPGGDGQRLSIQAQANGPRFQSYSLSFTEPWMGGRKPNSFTFSLTHSRQRGLDANGEETFRMGVTGATLYLGRRLKWPDDYFSLSNSISLLQYDLKNYRTGFTDNGQLLDLTLTDKLYNFSFNNTIARNNIDEQTFPTTGSQMTLSTTFTPPYSLFTNKDYSTLSPVERFKWMEYHKWMLDLSWFTKLTRTNMSPFSPKARKALVLNTRAHFGFLGSYNKDVGIGPFERFNLGGAGLAGFNFLLGTDIVALRGYADNDLKGDGLGQSGNQFAPGGIVFNKFVAELRYPLSLNPMATVYPIAFAEMGNTWDNYDNFNPFRLYRTVGVGVRIFMPMFGLIGFDWAKPFDDPRQITPRFHFMIGQQIR